MSGTRLLPAAPPARVELRSPAALATAATALLVVVAVADALVIAAGLNVHSMMPKVLYDPPAVSGDELARGDALMLLAARVRLLAVLVTAAVFLAWFRRVRRNVEVFRPGQVGMRPGWAIGGWFVPLANLWLPYRTAMDVWGATTSGDRTTSTWPVNAWWAAFVAASASGLAAMNRFAAAQYPEDVAHAARIVMATHALDIAAAVLALLFVRKLTAMQHRKATEGPVAAA